MIYLDNGATTRPHPLVAEAVMKTLTEGFGNPSSLYRLGLDAEKLVKGARQAAARTFGASPEEVFFTAGGTESDNTAIKGVWESRKKQGRRVITTAVEHPAVLECFKWLKNQGADVVIVPVLPDGAVDMKALEDALTEDTILVSVMHVNNETGAVMPVREVRSLMEKKAPGAVLHCDAVQSWGKEDCTAASIGADLISVSGHKVHGPKGIGALYVRKGLHIPPFIHGGGQESGFRSGTENVPGIAGMGKAAELILSEGPERLARMSAAKEHLLEGIRAEIDDIRVNGPEDGCPSVLNVSFLGCRGEVLLHSLDMKGICVSTGSACSSHSKGSHVLSAMGLSKQEIEGAVRFSFCGDNTVEEMEYVISCLKTEVLAQRRLRSAFGRRN